VESGAGVKELTLFAENGKVQQVCVDMGEPILDAAQIPVVAGTSPVVKEPIAVGDRTWEMTCVSMGNPHAVVFVENVADFPIEQYGPLFENHERFPKRTNTEFVQVISRSECSMRVWERGSAETWACGTGTCATVMACILNGVTDNRVLVHLRGGDLTIEYDPACNHIFMTGPATEVFSGEYEERKEIK
jgi:diaminopimelate epimerase